MHDFLFGAGVERVPGRGSEGGAEQEGGDEENRAPAAGGGDRFGRDGSCGVPGRVASRLDLLEGEARVADVSEAALGIAFETPLQELPEPRRRVFREGLPVDRSLEHAGDRVADGLSLEETAPGEALVEDAAERPDVGAAVHDLPARLLG